MAAVEVAVVVAAAAAADDDSDPSDLERSRYALGVIAGSTPPPSRTTAIVLTLALLVVTDVATAKPAPPDAVGTWIGAVTQKLRVKKGAKATDVTQRAVIHRAVTFAAGEWTTRAGEQRYTGSYEIRGQKLALTYDAASEAALADALATQIETQAASDGLSVDATIAFTRLKSKARVRDSKTTGRFLALKERHRFTVTLTGDVEKTRKGTYRASSALTSPPARAASEFEVDTPYIDDPVAFWARSDLYVMSPDVEPLDLWPDEVLFPSEHGIKIVVLLPGDYRDRSNGRLGPGTLIIQESGTEAEPILVIFAPEVGADLRTVPHPAERFRQSEARLLAIRIFNESHQVFHGLTFADGASAGLLHTASDNVIDSCLWHETAPQPLRIRFNSHRNVVQRCVFRRFDPSLWGHGDTVAINLSDEALTHNRILGNVILNYTDSYQHTDRDGEDYGLGAGTLIDGNFMGFTSEAYLNEPNGQLLCGENTIDLKMGGTEADPIRVTNNVFFGVRAAKAGCAASGSGGYAVTLHRRGTWVEMNDNVFVDVDSGVFLNAYFLNVDPGQGRIDPNLTFDGNTFSGVRSFSTAFPARTGRVLSGSSPATFTRNRIFQSERLMESEAFPGTGDLLIMSNDIYGPLELDPRDTSGLAADGNVFHAADDSIETVIHVPWTDVTLTVQSPR